MRLRKLSLLAVLLILTLIVSACGKKTTETGAGQQTTKSNYPEKTIKVVHMLPEGAPPAQFTKKLIGIISQKTGWKFEIVNMPGQEGADGVNAVWNAPHDGYTILGQTENMLGFSLYGTTKQTAKDWTFFQAFQERSVIVVKPDSKYKTIQEFLDASKTNPGTIKVAMPGEGSSFDMKLYAIEKATGAKFKHVGFVGAVGLMPALMSGEVDAALVPIVIPSSSISKGELIPLTVTDLEGYTFDGNVGKVESLTKLYPDFKKYLPLDASPGLALPADAPKDVIETFGKAFEEAMNTPEITEMLHYAVKLNVRGEDAKQYVANTESNFAWLAKEAGFAKIDPQALGIPKIQ